MNQELYAERLFDILINGDRPGARSLIIEMIHEGAGPRQIISQVYWPTYQRIEKLFRNDQITTLSYRLATRLLRVLVDQTSAALEFADRKNKAVFAWCGPNEGDELGAQMAVDLLEADGYSMTFSGGGIATDEILAQIHETQPQMLLMFCATPADLPALRHLIDTLREIGACPHLQIVVGGGVFNRADGLAEEIGADLWAVDPLELVDIINENPDHRAQVNTPEGIEAHKAKCARNKRSRKHAA